MAARVAFVIPVLNEAATIGGLLESLRAAFPAAQLIVVDGGSDDGTAARAARAHHAAIRFHDPQPAPRRQLRSQVLDVPTHDRADVRLQGVESLFDVAFPTTGPFDISWALKR